VVRTLDRKLLRDLWRLRSQLASIGAVFACGVGAVLAMRSTLDSIEESRAVYYEQARFPDVFASLERAPESLARRIASIPGVSVIDTRVVANVMLAVPGMTESATGHIVSVPDDGQPVLNTLYVREGRYLTPGAKGEVLVNEHFAVTNRLTLGDTLRALFKGRLQTLRIVGIVFSPEFIHAAAIGGTMFADSKHLAIIWMRRGELGPLYDMDGAFNDVAVRLGPGANESEVIRAMDELLAPYGGARAYGRKDQPSNSVLSGEIEQLRVFGTAMPAIFLFVAAFLLNVVLSRLIATQREEIATLKAFGYTNRAIGAHYLGFAAAAIFLGGAGGTALGMWTGSKYTGLYASFFKFPVFEHHTRVSLVLVAIAVSGAAAVAGTVQSILAAVRLPPAEGMRPSAPAKYRPLLLERLGWAGVLPTAVRMIVRDLERRPFRTAASILGVALAAAILVVGTFAFDSALYMSDLQFRVVDREDMAVTFASPRPLRVVHDVEHMPGVVGVEPFRTVAVRLSVGHRSRLISIMGLPRQAEMRRLVDRHGSAHHLPSSGLVLSAALANLLGIAAGDTATLELVERGGAVRRAPVVALLDELIGAGGYMELDALNRLVGEERAISGAYLRIDRDSLASVSRRLGALPAVSGSSTRAAMLASFDAQIAQSVRLTVTIVVSLAIVVALGVIYNGHRIALSERSRELASLRVLGFTSREVAGLLLGEQGAIDLVGMPVGLALGFLLSFWVISGFTSESYRFPVVVEPTTYLFSASVIVVAFVLASVPMMRRVYALDLVGVLKTRE
jgi:putative ABC transport system permease protein